MLRMCCVHRDGIHQPACEQRHEEIGHRRCKHGRGYAGHQPRLAAPVAEKECQNVTHRVIASRGFHKALAQVRNGHGPDLKELQLGK